MSYFTHRDRVNVLSSFVSPDGNHLMIPQGKVTIETGGIETPEPGFFHAVGWTADAQPLWIDMGLRFLEHFTVRSPDKNTDHSVVPLPNGTCAVFDAAGNLTHGKLADLEGYLVFYAELENDDRKAFTPSEFYARFGQANSESGR